MMFTSVVNATVRPAAGIVGVVAHPLQGAWSSAAKRFAKKPIQVQRATRLSDGFEAVRRASECEHTGVIEAFKRAKEPATEKERKDNYKEAAKEVLLEAEEDALHEASDDADSTVPPGSTPRTSTSTLAAQSISSSNLAPTPSSVQGDDGEDAQFMNDLEKAKQISLRSQADAPSHSKTPPPVQEDLTDEEKQFLTDIEKAKQLSLQ